MCSVNKIRMFIYEISLFESNGEMGESTHDDSRRESEQLTIQVRLKHDKGQRAARHVRFNHPKFRVQLETGGRTAWKLICDKCRTGSP